MSERKDYSGNQDTRQENIGSPYGNERALNGSSVRSPSDILPVPTQNTEQTTIPKQPLYWRQTQQPGFYPSQTGQQPSPPTSPSPIADQYSYAINAAIAQANANQQIWIDAFMKTLSDSMIEKLAHLLQAATSEVMQKAEENRRIIDNQIHSLQEVKTGSEAESEVQKQLFALATEMKERNTDVLRDFKNFQSVTAKNQQAELDKYHALHSSMANIQILTEIAQVYISVKKVIESEEGDLRRRLTNLVLEPLEEMLVEENGVTIQQTKEKELRPVRTCSTRRKIPIGDQSLHGTVARSISPSFSLGSVVFIREIVDIYVYDPLLNNDAAKSSIEEQPESSIEICTVPEREAEESPCKIAEDTAGIIESSDNQQLKD